MIFFSYVHIRTFIAWDLHGCSGGPSLSHFCTPQGHNSGRHLPLIAVAPLAGVLAGVLCIMKSKDIWTCGFQSTDPRLCMTICDIARPQNAQRCNFWFPWETGSCVFMPLWASPWVPKPQMWVHLYLVKKNALHVYFSLHVYHKLSNTYKENQLLKKSFY